MKKILFVCTGNTCRSPMARVISEKVFNEAGKDVISDSAGLNAPTNAPAADNAIYTASKHGCDLSGHKSKQVSEEFLYEFDIILAMTSAHKEILLNMADVPVYTVCEFAGCPQDSIEDPYGGDISVYEHCFCRLKNYIEKIGEIL